MKSIRQTIENKGKNILNVYFTAGHPTLNSVPEIIAQLNQAGVDLIELGMPYSDPLADGTTIQNSSAIALKNGQTIKNIFEQVASVRKTNKVPIILMGYLNQMMQYGIERFLGDAYQAGIKGLIIPDLPMDIYEHHYLQLFSKYEMEISFLITPMTSDQRIRQADRLSSAFIYVVSQSSITGKQGTISDIQIQYFERIKQLQLQSPMLIGFGIHDNQTRNIANEYSHGAIIGSAFIRALESGPDMENQIIQFIDQLH